MRRAGPATAIVLVLAVSATLSYRLSYFGMADLYEWKGGTERP